MLGEERDAIVVEGEGGEELGAAVAWGEDGDGAPLLLAGAPGFGEVVALRPDGSEAWRRVGDRRFGSHVWWRQGAFYAFQPGEGVLRVGAEGAELTWSLPDVRAVDLCPDGSPVWSESADEAVRCDEAGRLWTRCEGQACAVYLDPDGQTRTLGEVAPGGALAFVEAQPCWGDPRVEDDPDPGRVECEDGAALTGLDGDHLGVAIGAGRAAGVFNKWQVPARLRLPALDGSPAWAVERAAERTPAALAEHAASGWVAVGVPGALGAEAEQGRVYLVSP